MPFSFIRVDRAGNMSKRQSATGFHFSSSGGTCPLWNVYETFANPGKILVQIAQMPDGRNYMWVARTVERRASRYGQPGKTFAIGLGCELRHAHRLVYSEGLDLTGDNATPIGAGCRVCERDNCPQRAFPALGRALDINEHRSTVSPYLVKQPMSADSRARIPHRAASASSGPINWAIAKLGARGIRAPKFHLFNVLGQHRLLFLSLVAVLRLSALLRASCRAQDTELVILRVGHLRACEYELQQHRRLAKTRGVDQSFRPRSSRAPTPKGSPNSSVC